METTQTGACGNIAVIGGCDDDTGAPYYAAISAFKTGADVVHVFCARDAGMAIRSYGPELIVHPCLRSTRNSSEESDINHVLTWLVGTAEHPTDIHAVVIGPGLGRDVGLWNDIKPLFKSLRERRIPVIVDGDGLYMICKDPELVENYTLAILTPNTKELQVLCNSVCEEGTIVSALELASRLGDVTILRKGKDDVIATGRTDVFCSQSGGLRRCEGQGYVLAGCLAAFAGWGFIRMKEDEKAEEEEPFDWVLHAAFAACSLVRHSAHLAYVQHERATTTPDIIAKIGSAFKMLFTPVTSAPPHQTYPQYSESVVLAPHASLVPPEQTFDFQRILGGASASDVRK